MPLGSALKSTIDIDFTRAQGDDSSGFVTFVPPRIAIGSTILSTHPVRVEIRKGVGSVSLVRLPFGVYHVLEEIDGRSSYTFLFALPTSSPDVIQYESIAPASIVPEYFTSIRTVNNVLPDPVTGNVDIEASGGGIVPDATGSIKGILRLAGDLAGTASAPTLSPARDAQISGKYSKPGGGIPASDLADSVQDALLLGESAVQSDDLSGAVAALADLISARARPDRIVRITDTSKTAGAVNTYNMPNTDSVWTLFTDGPPEYTILANVGDEIEVPYSYLIRAAPTSFVDLAVVTGATPTRQKYLSSRSASPTFQGASGNYPTDAEFQGRSGVLGFTVEAGDLDGGFVRLRWVIKTSTANGKMYANANYPLVLSIRNTRNSGL